MPERRYDEDEVRRIIEIATTQSLDRTRARTTEGLTLADVQSIGSEVGVNPAVIARAAASLDAGAARQPRTSLGMPIEVGRVVALPRAPTDAEWEQLVAELRTTFRATGRVTSAGGLREWSNGNLHACVERDAAGHRLRLGTVKGDAAAVNALGATGLLSAAAVLVAMMLAGEPQAALVVPGIFGAAGASAFLTNRVRLPRWARQRAAQMEYIAERAVAIIGTSEEG